MHIFVLRRFSMDAGYMYTWYVSVFMEWLCKFSKYVNIDFNEMLIPFLCFFNFPQ